MKGIYTAIVTPFKSGDLDVKAFKNLLERQIDAGIHGIVVCGTTGESPVLSLDEKKTLFKISRATIPRETIFVAGTGTNSTRTTIDLCHIAEDEGADALLIVTPYYNKPPQQALVDHYLNIAEATNLPIILYNVPSRTGVDLSVESILQLSEHPNIVALKEASSDMRKVAKLAQNLPDSFVLLSGDDQTFLPFLSLGGDGIISVYTNLNPRRFLDIYEKIRENALKEAQSLFYQAYPVLEALSISTNPIPIKEALSLAGLIERDFRMPLRPLDRSSLEHLKRALERYENQIF